MPKEKHLEELSVLKYQLESAQAELQGYQAEHHVAKSLMKRILQASDNEIDTIMLSKEVAEKFGMSFALVLEDSIASKHRSTFASFMWAFT